MVRTVHIVVAITGSSGVRYGVRLLERLEGEKDLVVSRTGIDLLRHEMSLSLEDLHHLVSRTFDDSDLFAPLSSGSHPFDAMVIVPCSESSLAKIASGISDTLITRTAAVCLKEGRRLILVPRESPVSAIMLENELKLARLGVTILPASPGFYPAPQSIDDMVDFVVGKILDQLGQPNALFRRWGT